MQNEAHLLLYWAQRTTVNITLWRLLSVSNEGIIDCSIKERGPVRGFVFTPGRVSVRCANHCAAKPHFIQLHQMSVSGIQTHPHTYTPLCYFIISTLLLYMLFWKGAYFIFFFTWNDCSRVLFFMGFLFKAFQTSRC